MTAMTATITEWKPAVPLPPAFETERAVIRLYEKGDGPALFTAVNAERNPLNEWLPWKDDAHRDVDDSIFFVESSLRTRQSPECSHYELGIFERSGFERGGNEILGGVGYYRVDRATSKAELGYWIRGDRHGEGLCTEVVAPFVSAGFRSQSERGWGFRRITLRCSVENVGSVRIAEKLGFRLEQRERAECLHPKPTPRLHDMHGYAVLASEWDFGSDRAQPGIGWD